VRDDLCQWFEAALCGFFCHQQYAEAPSRSSWRYG
jgi:hypothetical protein